MEASVKVTLAGLAWPPGEHRAKLGGGWRLREQIFVVHKGETSNIYNKGSAILESGQFPVLWASSQRWIAIYQGTIEGTFFRGTVWA